MSNTVSDVFSINKNLLNYVSINYDASIPNLTNIYIKQKNYDLSICKNINVVWIDCGHNLREATYFTANICLMSFHNLAV